MKILIECFQVRFFQRNEVYYCFDGNYQTATRRATAKMSVSKRVAFRLLALAVPDPMKMEIKIAYPERDIMECTLVVIVFSVNAGKVINTRREVVEAVSLMLFKSLILCVHPEASWSEGAFPRIFYFLAWSLFFTDGKYKGI